VPAERRDERRGQEERASRPGGLEITKDYTGLGAALAVADLDPLDALAEPEPGLVEIEVGDEGTQRLPSPKPVREHELHKRLVLVSLELPEELACLLDAQRLPRLHPDLGRGRQRRYIPDEEAFAFRLAQRLAEDRPHDAHRVRAVPLVPLGLPQGVELVTEILVRGRRPSAGLR
jgi:hypothetical protein